METEGAKDKLQESVEKPDFNLIYQDSDMDSLNRRLAAIAEQDRLDAIKGIPPVDTSEERRVIESILGKQRRAVEAGIIEVGESRSSRLQKEVEAGIVKVGKKWRKKS